MSDTYFSGTSYLVLIGDDYDNMLPVGCGTTNDLEGTRDAIDVSSKCVPSGKWIAGDKFDQTINFSGFAVIVDGANKESFKELYDRWVAGDAVPTRFAPVNPVSPQVFYQGLTFVTGLTINAPYNEGMTYDIVFRVAEPPMSQFDAY